MEIDLKHVAKLARLKIHEEELAQFQKEMNDILGMVENLPTLEDGYFGLDPQHPMTLRADEIGLSTRRDEILQNAPQTQAGCFVVPKTVE